MVRIHDYSQNVIYRKSYIKPPPPPPRVESLIYFKPFEGVGGGLKETGGFFNYLETPMVSVLHKELEYNVEKLRYKKFQVKQPRTRIKAKLNHPGSVHTKFCGRDWLIQSIIY